MHWVTTTLVLEKLKNADEEAWNLFVGRFRRPVVKFAHDLGLAPHEAEDAAQEVLAQFVTAYREGRYDRNQGRLHSWLFGIAHKTVLNRRRTLAREQRRSPAGQRTAFWDAIPGEEEARQSWDKSWQQAVLDHCMTQVRAELEPKTVQAFELFAMDGRPASDVAAELEMSSNAVFLAKHRVLKRIRELRDQIDDVE